MFALVRNAARVLNKTMLLDYTNPDEVPVPECYANQSTSLNPCGKCTKPATALDTATGQTSDTVVYSFRHNADGWLCDANN
ncbi:hypothetical protein GUITHDRAFT_156679 [Guillardia theta CCMP2712]|uniref:Uncharacterized protein n=1 Tax=Guillardia theta (strain CCMP2712) TaxID=905079 RepID=L1I496_GUITC|nr:hypothetical protein GUITHDRAFT_156679 [Guillardia theta CCMP2712]EKX31093.1 hypothetical protein GUITHDRAFT_156679 [Guillardia theta CCMP2712]|mmetsp:Transcript_17776/g.58491  ORF Transcript_17776/g.58491 Transcript_17776/m.58491 type:complete len:81 (+) Transcript_17776:72-314(+)|eukprot:XP_005818073.1 hypothetical protein GUITHDRAFT_156679 [Guillardia theta CCMP2712]